MKMMRIQRFYITTCFVVSLTCFSFLILEPQISFDGNFLASSKQVIAKYAEKIKVLQRVVDGRNDSFDPLQVDDKKLLRVKIGTPEDSTTDFEESEVVTDVIDYNISSKDEYIAFGSTEPSSEPPFNEYENENSCKAQENIVFLKTHKTGSSTITNILNRYADLRELRVALPTIGFNRFRWPIPFHWAAVDLWRMNGETASVLCNHARYNRLTMNLIMKDNTKYITILRNPVDQWESTFNYMEFTSYLNLLNDTTPMETFLTKPHTYLRNMAIRMKGFPEAMNLVRNGMFFDLGMSPRVYNNTRAIKRAIEIVDRDFTLVLIMEYFDESLILLKREFCWDLDDILYVRFNQRHDRNATNQLPEHLTKRIRAWNRADVLLYEHFNKTFWQKIQSHGAAFYRDLEEFRIKNAKMQDKCVAKKETTETAFRLKGKIRSFLLNPSVDQYNKYFCQKILTNEVDYIKYFRYKFNPRRGYHRQLTAEQSSKGWSGSNELYWRLQRVQMAQLAERQRPKSQLARRKSQLARP